MILIMNPGYPDRIGKRFAFAGYGVGPASYNSTTKDVFALPGYQNYVDVLHGAVSVSGTYIIRPIPTTVGNRNVWKISWIVLATGVEAANATNLSAEKVVLGGTGGTY